MKTIEYDGETFIYSGENGLDDSCYYPENGRKNYFVRSVRADEIDEDSPIEENFEVDGKRYRLTRAMY